MDVVAAVLVAMAIAALPGLERSGAATEPPPPSNEGSGTGMEEQRPAGAKETCADRSEADFPAAFTSPDNLVVGPLALVGAGGRVHFSASFGGQKFQALVRNGHRVTVALPQGARPGAGLAYGPLPPGTVGPGDAHRVVSFIACRRGQDSGSSTAGRPVTFWSGGVLVRSPRCVPIRIWVDDHPLRTAVIRLGVARCT